MHLALQILNVVALIVVGTAGFVYAWRTAHGARRQPPAIQEIRRLQLGAGDRLVLRITDPHDAVFAQAKQVMEEAFPDHQPLVLVGRAEDIDLTVVPAATDA